MNEKLSQMSQCQSKRKEQKTSVLQDHVDGGPLGLGDPNDRTLNSFEKAVVIPKRIRTAAEQSECAIQFNDFQQCGKKNSWMNLLEIR